MMWSAPPVAQLLWALGLCLGAAAVEPLQVKIKVCAPFTGSGFPDDSMVGVGFPIAFGKYVFEKEFQPVGGVPRVNVTYDFGDTRFSPGNAIACGFTGWYQDQVALVLGSLFSSLSFPLAQLGASLGGAQLDWGATSDLLSGPAYPNYVRTCVPDSALSLGMADLLVKPDLYNYSRLAVLYETDAWGTGLESRLMERIQRIRPDAFVKEVPLPQTADPAARLERLRTLKGSALRIIVVLCQSTVTWQGLDEAEFRTYITGPTSFIIIPSDATGAVKDLAAAGSSSFKGMQAMGPKAATIAPSRRTALNQMWNNMTLQDFPEPFQTWASCLGGNFSAKTDCYWGKEALFQSSTRLGGTYFGWAFDATYLLHTAIQNLANRGVAASSIRGALLIREIMNSTAQVSGLSGPVVLTADGDRFPTGYDLSFYDGSSTFLPFGVYDAISGNFSVTQHPIFADGSTVRPMDTFPPCMLGFFHQDGLCLPAPPGFFSPQGTLTAPIPCPPGSITEIGAQDKCLLCPSGFYISASGGTACSRCAAGTYAGKPGASICELCMRGYHANSSGQAECELCPRGGYTDTEGAALCTSCPELMSTQDVASRSISQCECLEGHYRGAEGNCTKSPEGAVCRFGAHSLVDCRCDEGYFGANGLCHRCTEGMVCDEIDLQEPKQKAGFYVELASGDIGAGTAEFTAYACHDTVQCIDGKAGTCASGRTGLACGHCRVNYYKAGAGVCAQCTPADTAPVIIIFIAGLLLVFPMYWFACPDVSRRSMNVLTVTNVISQLIFAVQALGVFSDMRVRWADPVAGLLRTFRLIQLDFDFMKLQCVVPGDDPVSKFVGEMFLFPAFTVYLAIAAAALHFTGRYKFTFKRYINVEGLAGLVLHIPLTLAVMRPFYCVTNPNGTRHVQAHPDVLCWESKEHKAFIAVAILGMLAYPVTNISVVTSITWRHRSLLCSDAGLKVLDNYQFLFDRFTPQSYYYALVYFWRGMLLPLIPVLMPDSGIGQITAVMFLLQLCFWAVVRMQPWASPLGNVTETMILLGCILLVHVSGFLVDAETEGRGGILGLLLLLIIVIMVAFALAVVLVSVYRWMARTDQYAVFLCHHKHAAGVLARLCKIRMRELTSRPVFLDSDELQELALIFDIVRARTRTVVGLMTKSILERMWCAGELTTAVRNKIPLVLLACEDYTPLDDEKLQCFGMHWSSEERATLATAGMPLEIIRDAYKNIASLEAVTLNRLGGREMYTDAIKAVAARCGLRAGLFMASTDTTTSAGSQSTTDQNSHPEVIVVGCKMQAEARCVCYILSEQLQTVLRAPVHPAFSAAEAVSMTASAKYLLIVLTKGLFQDATFVELLLSLPQDLEIVTVMADTAFEFPGADHYNEFEAVHGARGKEVVVRIKQVVNRLALPYSALGSEALLSTQVGELVMRFNLRNHPTRSKPATPAGTKKTEEAEAQEQWETKSETAVPGKEMGMPADAVWADLATTNV